MIKNKLQLINYSITAFDTNGGEEERVYVIDKKARGKETSRKTET
jgi:hypothetical protein